MQQAIFDAYLHHLTAVNNWNLVDASAPHIVGAHLYARDRGLLPQLASASNMWSRRVAIVATWYFIRRDDLEDTLQLAKQLLRDRHELIHKATGWMLREVGKRDVARLQDFLERYAPQMPRTMLRYAIERLPEVQRQAYLRKRL